jgi:Cysteine dioxygenase type I
MRAILLTRPSCTIAAQLIQNARVTERFDELATSGRTLSPEECAALARAAAELVDLASLSPEGEGSFALLWRNEHSEGWLNTWWEPRDTGFHDHGGSCVGVYVLAGRARAEGLVVRGERSLSEYRAGDEFSAPATAIHRMEHEPGAITIHVYSPPLGSIGHYEVVDGELHRHAGAADEVSPPSPGLTAALEL